MTATATPEEPASEALPTVENDTVGQDSARALISDLFRRSPAIYWFDLLMTAGTAWLLTAVYFTAPAWSALQVSAFVVAAFLFFRAGTFIHEIVHMPGGQMEGFKRTWNLLLGVPFLMPWVMYRNHIEHHNHRHFGTPADGEYLPLGSSPRVETLKYLAQAPLLPLFMMIRFGILGPASWLHRGLREWVLLPRVGRGLQPLLQQAIPEARRSASPGGRGAVPCLHDRDPRRCSGSDTSARCICSWATCCWPARWA